MRSVFLYVFLFSAVGFGAKVQKSNHDYFIAGSDPGKPWGVGETVCVRHAGTRIVCGKVLKVGKQTALVHVVKAYGQTIPQPGDAVERFDAKRKVASEASVDAVVNNRPSQSFSQFQISGEIFGAGLVYSVFASYRPFKFLAFNLGVSYLSISGTTDASGNSITAGDTLVQVPFSVSGLFGGRSNFFEVLGGADFLHNSASVTGTTGIGGAAQAANVALEMGVGYRYWPINHGFHFRATVYGFYAASSFFPWFGLSFGYAF